MKQENSNLDTTLLVRMSKEDKSRLEKKAKREHMSLSAFARERLFEDGDIQNTTIPDDNSSQINSKIIPEIQKKLNDISAHLSRQETAYKSANISPQLRRDWRAFAHSFDDFNNTLKATLKANGKAEFGGKNEVKNINMETHFPLMSTVSGKVVKGVSIHRHNDGSRHAYFDVKICFSSNVMQVEHTVTFDMLDSEIVNQIAPGKSVCGYGVLFVNVQKKQGTSSLVMWLRVINFEILNK